MKLAQLALAAVGSTAIFTMSTANAQIFADWTFGTGAAGTSNTPVADLGLHSASVDSHSGADAIGMTNSYNSTTSTNTDDIVLGKSGDTGPNGIADLTNEWRVRGASPGNGWSTQAPVATQGAQFFSATSGGSVSDNAVKVTFDFYVTSAAEANMELLYTIDHGTTWNNLALTIPSGDVGLTNKTGSAAFPNTVNGAYVSAVTSNNQNWFTGLTATIADPAALNIQSFGVEMVNASTGTDDLNATGTVYNNSSGNWRFDNIIIEGVVAAPEPSSWLLGMIATALLGVCLYRRRTA